MTREAGFPDFYIVGQPKTGTTALHAALSAHPDIYMPKMKETHFFSDELLGADRPRHLPTTVDDYLQLFRPAAQSQMVGEASTLYLWSRTAAPNIAQVRPDAKLIAIVREPAGLLRSLHLQFLRVGIEDEKDLRLALELEAARRKGDRLPPKGYWRSLLFYSDHTRYAEQLGRFLTVFPREQLLVLLYDDFRASNPDTIRTILNFLGLGADVALPTAEVYPSIQVRSRRAQEIVAGITEGRGHLRAAFKAGVKAVTPSAFRRKAAEAMWRRFVYAPPPPVDERLMDELRRQNEQEVKELAHLLGRDLITTWNYDRWAAR